MHIYVFENFKNSVSSATTFEAFVFIESINSSARIKKSNKSEHLPQIQKQFYGWLAFWLVIIVVACYNRRIKKKVLRKAKYTNTVFVNKRLLSFVFFLI